MSDNNTPRLSLAPEPVPATAISVMGQVVKDFLAEAEKFNKDDQEEVKALEEKLKNKRASEQFWAGSMHTLRRLAGIAKQIETDYTPKPSVEVKEPA